MTATITSLTYVISISLVLLCVTICIYYHGWKDRSILELPYFPSLLYIVVRQDFEYLLDVPHTGLRAPDLASTYGFRV